MTYKDIKPETYYLCKTENNHWITKGTVCLIYMWCKDSEKTLPIINKGGTLYSMTTWDVRELDSEEIRWVERCLEEGKIVPKEEIINSYSIF